MHFRIGPNTKKDLEDLKYIAKMTIVRDFFKAYSNLDSLIGLTCGQTLNYMFADEIIFDTPTRNKAIEDEFSESAYPILPRLANELTYRNQDFAKLSFNYLDLKAKFLKDECGSEWYNTDLGRRVYVALDRIYGHVHNSQSISLRKYAYIVHYLESAYSKVQSDVDWKLIMDIHNYGD